MECSAPSAFPVLAVQPPGDQHDGSIVGSVSSAGGQKGFLFEDGAFTVFDVPLSTGVCLTFRIHD